MQDVPHVERRHDVEDAQVRDGLGVVQPRPEGDQGAPVVADEGEALMAARTAVRLGDRGLAARAAAALRGARAEHAGAASGMLTLGPVARYLAEAEACAGAA